MRSYEKKWQKSNLCVEWARFGFCSIHEWYLWLATAANQYWANASIIIDVWHFVVWKRIFLLVFVFISSAIQFRMNDCDQIHPKQEDKKKSRSNSIHKINPFTLQLFIQKTKKVLIVIPLPNGWYSFDLLFERTTLYRWNNGIFIHRMEMP